MTLIFDFESEPTLTAATFKTPLYGTWHPVLTATLG